MIDDKTEEITVKCQKCGVDIIIKWNNGIISEPHFVLIADWVYHSECWDELMEQYPPQDNEQ